MIGFYFPRPVVTMAKAEMFNYPGLKQFLQLYGAIPVRRGEADLQRPAEGERGAGAGLHGLCLPGGHP